MMNASDAMERAGEAAVPEVIAFEMIYTGDVPNAEDTLCIPFRREYWDEYMRKYNASFHDMRAALAIEPVDFYTEYAQMAPKAQDVYLCLQEGVIAGSVSCCGPQIDDLFVDSAFRGQGLGRRLLLWGMHRIRQNGYRMIVLHVAEQNHRAMQLYQKAGFIIQRRERVRRG